MVGGWKLMSAVQNLHWITALLHKLKLIKENPSIFYFFFGTSMPSELQKEYKILLLISVMWNIYVF